MGPATKTAFFAWWANLFSTMFIGTSAWIAASAEVGIDFLDDHYRAVASLGVAIGLIIQWVSNRKANKEKERHNRAMESKDN